MKAFLGFCGLFLVLLTVAQSTPAAPESIGSTWSNQNSLLIGEALEESTDINSASTKKMSDAVLKFKPSGDSGVAKILADALGRNAAEKANLKSAFLQIKSGYESEIAKEKKSNDLAAALTFFIVSNVMAHHQNDAPPDEGTDEIYDVLKQKMAAIPEVAKMTNSEKQKLHDWLVIMGGYVMWGHTDARQKNDAKGLQTFKELADYSMRLVLGIDAARFDLSDAGMDIASTPAAETSDAKNNANQIVGVWSKSAASAWSLNPGSVMTNAGYYKGRYIFAANGTYAYKGESWGGPTRSNEFWTFEENGSYSVNGSTLTITPKASKRTLRNGAGAIQKTENASMAKAIYQWQLFYFEGLNETDLVLKPAKPVTRDGAFSGNSSFPNSYLYSEGSTLEWKF